MGKTPKGICISLIVLWLLSQLGAGSAAAKDQARASRAIGYIARQQRPSGSTPAFSPIGSTSDAILAIYAAGVGGDVQPAAVGYLRRQVSKGNVVGIGLIAKVAMAVEASGLDARRFGGRNLLESIRRTRRANGRFGSATVLDQALAVLALRAAATFAPADSAQWLVDAECPDGGWAFDRPYRPATDNARCNDGSGADFFLSDTNTTAYAVMALEAAGEALAGDPRTFFERIRDRRNGGWGYTWGFRTTDANSTALVLQSYAARSWPLPAGSLWALRKLQFQRCGAFAFQAGSPPDAGATIGAVPGLLRKPFPIEPVTPLGPSPATPACNG
jgi:hypothetical protein